MTRPRAVRRKSLITRKVRQKNLNNLRANTLAAIGGTFKLANGVFGQLVWMGATLAAILLVVRHFDLLPLVRR